MERFIAKYILECSVNSKCSFCDVSDFLERVAQASIQAGSKRVTRNLYNSIHGEIQSIRDSKVYSEAWGRAYSRLKRAKGPGGKSGKSS